MLNTVQLRNKVRAQLDPETLKQYWAPGLEGDILICAGPNHETCEALSGHLVDVVLFGQLRGRDSAKEAMLNAFGSIYSVPNYVLDHSESEPRQQHEFLRAQEPCYVFHAAFCAGPQLAAVTDGK